MRALTAALVLALPLSAHAAPGTPPPPDSNLRIVFEILGGKPGKDVGLARYEVVAAPDWEGVTASYRGSVAIPVPAPEGVASFSYQNVGFKATLELVSVPDGRIRTHGHFEASGLDAGAPPKTPPWSIDESIDLALRIGKPLVVGSADTPGVGPLRVSITLQKAD